MVLKLNGCQLSLLLKIIFLLPYVLLTHIIFFIYKSTLIRIYFKNYVLSKLFPNWILNLLKRFIDIEFKNRFQQQKRCVETEL